MSITIRTKDNAGPKSCRGVEILSEDGRPVRGVYAVDIRIRPDEIVTADIEIAAIDVSTVAEPRWLVINPATGSSEIVRRIEFANGDVWDANG